MRKTGLAAISLRDDDELIEVKNTDGKKGSKKVVERNAKGIETVIAESYFDERQQKETVKKYELVEPYPADEKAKRYYKYSLVKGQAEEDRTAYYIEEFETAI